MIKNAIASYLRSVDVDCAEVTGFDERTESGGYCDSCYYEYTALEIYYKDSSGTNHVYDWGSDFSSLIWTLDNHSDD